MCTNIPVPIPNTLVTKTAITAPTTIREKIKNNFFFLQTIKIKEDSFKKYM